MSSAQAGRLTYTVEKGWFTGAPSAEGACRNGEKVGLWLLWGPNGYLRGKGLYAAGEQMGYWLFWHRGNILAAAGRYDAGKETGAWIFWQEGWPGEAGEIDQERTGQYEDGVRVRDLEAGEFEAAVAVAVSRSGEANLLGRTYQHARYGILYDVFLEDDAYWPQMPFESISLERKGCYGECPVFKVVFHRGGRAEYVGTKYTPRQGTFQGEIGAYGYALLCSVLERMSFSYLEDSYAATWTDDETVVVEVVTSSGEKKSVSDYGRQAPPELFAFQALFDRLTEKVAWRETAK